MTWLLILKNIVQLLHDLKVYGKVGAVGLLHVELLYYGLMHNKVHLLHHPMWSMIHFCE